MRAAHLGLSGLVLSLLLSLVTVTGPSFAAPGSPASDRTVAAGNVSAVDLVSSKPRKPRKPRRVFVPARGVTFNDPMSGRRRAILTKVVKSIKATRKGQYVRIITWNLDDRPIATELIRAKRRGVRVQVVVSAVVDNGNYTRLARALNRNKRDDSFAVQCRGACRSNRKIMHSKIFLFSKVGHVQNISMFGSVNLTTPAGNRQWNDMVTTHNKGLYDYLARVIAQSARDKAVARPYDVRNIGRFRVTLFPVGNRNPVLAELRKIRCNGATGGAGSNGHTVIRIAVAGWFDAYGGAIAERLRQMWDRGCNIKIITTLAGRGVNQILKDGRGRGPVPIRELSIDRNGDEIPERYLHMKAMSVSGVYGKNKSANVVFTGSPNWSTRAQRSEEVWIRILQDPKMVRSYNSWIDRLYGSSYTSMRVSTPAALGLTATGGPRAAGVTRPLPSWFELD
jgi:phosphatidylserine/phosphatidylglycerophosphate/cardiolipin synthase-like enzyme